MHIAIIGCGNMGQALAQQLCQSHTLLLHDHDWTKSSELAQKIGGKAYKDVKEAIHHAQFILLCIKPTDLQKFAHLHAQNIHAEQTLISILAGTPLDELQRQIPHIPIVRVMPNLAVSYGEGVIGIAESPTITSEMKKKLQEIFTPLGFVYWIEEKSIDALTVLIGSGPAFIYTLMEAMIEAGVAMGFQASEAQSLIIKMMHGSLVHLEKTNKHPAELKRQITSPGGTTIAGLRRLEQENLRSGLIETFLACFDRTKELTRSFDQSST